MIKNHATLLPCYPQINMALQSLHHHLQSLTCRRFPSSSSFPTTTFKPQPLTLTRPISIRISPVARGVVEESQESSEPETERAEEKESELASELKKAMQERKDNNNDNFWSGVAQEISQIEWPPFPKVFSTTGVVLAVIFGSSVVLLTVNAVFAELSDRVFAARGLQDFFT